MKTCDIRIRDPYVLTDTDAGRYYLYGTTDENPWSGPGQGFSAYVGTNLADWQGPFSVFAPPVDFWADCQFWAPEVHRYAGCYYMLASFKAENRRRGVQILRAKSPLGPFVPISDGPITPPEWESLDGTLYLDGQGRPWLIFCHEWTQLGDGAICGMRLEKDLSAAAEAPVTLFHASQSGWSVADTGQIVRKTGENYVTDGPFLHRCEDGTLWMLWSSYARCGYAVGLAKSLSSDIPGPWQHLTKPLFERNGGHGMLFLTLKGQLRLAIHRPNDTPWERPCFLPVEEKNGRLTAREEDCENAEL